MIKYKQENYISWENNNWKEAKVKGYVRKGRTILGLENQFSKKKNLLSKMMMMKAVELINANPNQSMFINKKGLYY